MLSDDGPGWDGTAPAAGTEPSGPRVAVGARVRQAGEDPPEEALARTAGPGGWVRHPPDTCWALSCPSCPEPRNVLVGAERARSCPACATAGSSHSGEARGTQVRPLQPLLAPRVTAHVHTLPRLPTCTPSLVRVLPRGQDLRTPRPGWAMPRARAACWLSASWVRAPVTGPWADSCVLVPRLTSGLCPSPAARAHDWPCRTDRPVPVRVGPRQQGGRQPCV